ncbi:MAG: SAM-dependent chlorinase/fluorinase [Deltaproteobacteria bacterium]|nr:SAM-dependent chlorinase/fluorinase [Deltaproteobacteria bacterium]MBW2050645.1 SAM-dependent chlorinase/fluorinase [Deltaproteobacteria bacterium]MBW2139461.1 SAM-dependent chlorinase/fluorinase [Deltaproteobacteria bacterium]
MSIITLTTDFGQKDHFVGVMKGVILGINPAATLVDLVHDLPPQGLTQAAFILMSAFSFFPKGTVHLAVVDPGVGTKRHMVVIEAGNHYFVGPDNGLFSYVLDKVPLFEARYIENPSLALPQISRTFHGRDYMAPAAAHLSLGFAFDEVGPLANDLTRLKTLRPEIKPNLIRGEVIYIDRFGNLITNIPNEECEGWEVIISAGPLTLHGLARSYSEVGPGKHLAVTGSSGFLEIARSMDSAENPPDLTLGTPVQIKKSKQ